MPPIKSLPAQITSLTDQELADQLIQYNFTPGPILASTRSVYERKLYKLQTGQEAPSDTKYLPVDDDDDDADEESEDDEVVLQQHQPRQRQTRSVKTEANRGVPYQPPLTKPAERPTSASRPQSARSPRPPKEVSPSPRGGLPTWVKLLAIVLVAVLVFLVIKNMEADPASQGPDIPEHLEMNL